MSRNAIKYVLPNTEWDSLSLSLSIYLFNEANFNIYFTEMASEQNAIHDNDINLPPNCSIGTAYSQL